MPGSRELIARQESGEQSAAPPIDERLSAVDIKPHSVRVINMLLDALERCAGDPPDCPHCGPARGLALQLIGEKGRRSEGDPVELVGRVAAAPAFRRSREGTLVARFPLASTSLGSARASWLQVFALNHLAENVRDVIRSGATVSIVGYLSSREELTGASRSKTIQELQATAITQLED